MRYFSLDKFKNSRLEKLIQEEYLDKETLEYLNVNDLIPFFPKGLSNADIIQIQKEIDKIHKSRVKYKKNPETWTISSSSKNIDNLLDSNGIKSQEITLFYGKSNSGKTQISHQICINTYKKFQKDLESSENEKLIVYIDSEGTFRPDRIMQMAQSQGVDKESILNSLSVIKIKSIANLKMAIDKLRTMLLEDPIKIIVIDSLTNYFSLELGKEFQKKEPNVWKLLKDLNNLLKQIEEYAITHNIAVVCTSQVRAAINEDTFFEVVPVLGNRLNRIIKQWILLGLNEDIPKEEELRTRRFAHLINGQTKKEAIVHFHIDETGIKDVYI